MQRSALFAGCLVAAIVAVYWPSFHGAFVFDDLTSIVKNPNIRSIATSFGAPPELTVSGRPIASVTLAINYAIAGGTQNTWSFHAVNLLIHACAALALFGVVRRTLQSPRLAASFGNDATILAAAVSLIWAVHPLNTSAVTYVVQRVESLMALFFLLTLYCSIRAIQTASRFYGILAIAACALGMATKEVMVGAPIVVVLWAWTFASGKGPSSPLAPRHWPLYAGLAATWFILAFLVWHERRGHSVGAGLGGWTTWSYLLTQTGVIAHYVRLAFWPSPLVFDYAWPAAHSIADVAPYVALLAVAAVLTIVGLVRRTSASFLGAWFFITLAPTSSVLPIATEVVAEHRIYLPLMALIGLVVIGTAGLLRHQRAAIAAVVALAIAVSATFGVMTFRRNLDYGSEERLWADTVHKAPANARAHHNYGTVLLGRHAFAPAIEQFNQALAINPDYAEAHMALGLALCSERRIKEAEVHFARSIALGGYPPEYQIKAATAVGNACADRANSGGGSDER